MTVNHLTTLGAIRALRTLAKDVRMLNWEADDALNFAADELERLSAIETAVNNHNAELRAECEARRKDERVCAGYARISQYKRCPTCTRDYEVDLPKEQG